MGKFGVLDQVQELQGANALINGITVGEVIDTNDPQQMGRVRAVCPSLGDLKTQPRKHTPWAMYGSPFAGVNQLTKRGRDETPSEGPVAYGMWAIPKIGSYVLIMCIDGDPNHRVWLGCLPPQFFPHTMPHGRYSDELGDGPLTSTEKPLEPLHSNMGEAFSGGAAPARESFEFQSRGADNQVAYLSPEEIATRVEFSKTADDRTKGYTQSRIQPDLNFPSTEGTNWDSQIYSWTTPGFHALHMDDRAESCRMRFRTTSGHQIIFDDTNERIYVSTANGKTWIEIDESGTIDIYGEQDISIRSAEDINLTADKTVRIAGKEGIHLITDGEFRAHAKLDVSIKTDASLRVRSASTMYLQSDETLDVQVATAITVGCATLDLAVSGATKIKTGTFDQKSSMIIIGSSNFNVAANGDIGNTGIVASSGIHYAPDFQAGSIGLVGHKHAVAGGGSYPGIAEAAAIAGGEGGGSGSTSASPAAPASVAPANELLSYFTSRVPDHEPWARVYLDPANVDDDTAAGPGVLTIFTDIVGASEYTYDDANVGKGSAARGRTVTRNDKWLR